MAQALVSRLTAGERTISRPWPLTCAFILFLSALIYVRAMHGLPIWEDDRLIKGYPTFSDVLTKPFLNVYFRPLVSFSFFLDNLLWGGEAFMYHQTNILLHVLTTAVVLVLFQVAFGSRRIAALGGLLFAVQPAQVSTVAWIGGRTDSLSTLWVALFAWATLRAAQSEGRERIGPMVGAVLAFCAAIFTKEQNLALLPLVPLAFACFKPANGGQERRLPWKESLPFVVVGATFLILWKVCGPPLLESAPHPLSYVLPLTGRTLTYYGLLLWLPSPQWMHSLTVIPLHAWGVFSIFTGYALLLLCGWLFRHWFRKAPAAAWFLALMVLALFPVSNILPIGSLIVAPFRAGVAGLGCAALMAWLILCWRSEASSSQSAPSRAALVGRWGVGGLLSAWCLGLSVWGVTSWSSPTQVYRRLIQYDPGCMYAREGMIGTMMNRGKPQEALQQAEELLNWFYGSEAWRDPQVAVRELEQDPAVVNRIHISNGDKRSPRRALTELFLLLGYARLALTERHDGPAAFQTSLLLTPEDPAVNLAMGRWRYMEKDWHGAEKYLVQSVKIRPQIPASRRLLGQTYEELGRWQEAIAQYQAMIRNQPWEGQAYLDLAAAQNKAGDPAAQKATLTEGAKKASSHLDKIHFSLRELKMPIPPNEHHIPVTKGKGLTADPPHDDHAGHEGHADHDDHGAKEEKHDSSPPVKDEDIE